MHYLFDFWLVRDRHEELLREAARQPPRRQHAKGPSAPPSLAGGREEKVGPPRCFGDHPSASGRGEG
ncbi:MAG: hypothetical protein AVDCRST_MAG02-1341 [uncultured Rubrobacteraceae bacterium]|uniref:Uncharacterized protein n=1 Tax=uncultured Rubrobacteraceae bacterium TaxID=349277 RepID=A0A6J4QY68_9ACTN|nr:MAG: hypothetical protein AVDCRST_MAG02-1341 [uncultured Rubrobacteraceae bacterium]